MRIYRMNETEAKAAYDTLLENYCGRYSDDPRPQPAEIVVPRLQRLDLYDRERGGDVVVHHYEGEVEFPERFACSQDRLDAALFAEPS